MSGSGRIPTAGGQPLAQSPFGMLSGADLPPGPKAAVPDQPAALPTGPGSRTRGRVELRRTTAGRGGKTVTVVTGFTGIGLPEKETLCKRMRSACGCGGTVKDGDIEIQGDQRDKIAAILADAGFRPVLAGG